MSVFTNIREDIKAILERDPAARDPVQVFFTYPGFHAREWHRLAHTLYNWKVPALPWVAAHLSRFLTGIEIHPAAKIGRRLFIDHGMGVVIGETSEIGDDVTLYQGVTLGGTSLQKIKRHPTLKDNVVVGVGAKLIGDIAIGENSKIGAGSVVVSSVPPHATVVGVPGRVIAVRNPDTDTVEKLPDPVWEKLDNLSQQVTELEKRLAEVERRKVGRL